MSKLEKNKQGVIAIADLHIDVSLSLVQRNGRQLALQDKTFNLFKSLMNHAPGVARHDQLHKAVWGDTHVTPDALTQRIKMLREALGPAPDGGEYIVSVHGEGYRLRYSVKKLTTRTMTPQTRRFSLRHLLVLTLVIFLLVILYEILDQAGFAHLFHKALHQQ